jgi:NAD(P)-dependent dehydrogenase (short-subunit alcohol dehydrogenase family)
MKLQHKLIWISDGDSDCGRALIRRLALEGAHFLIGSGSNGQRLEAELAYIRERGLQAIITDADLTSGAAVRDLLQQVEAQLGPVDVLIHNHNEVFRSSVAACEEEAFLGSAPRLPERKWRRGNAAALRMYHRFMPRSRQARRSPTAPPKGLCKCLPRKRR